MSLFSRLFSRKKEPENDNQSTHPPLPENTPEPHQPPYIADTPKPSAAQENTKPPKPTLQGRSVIFTAWKMEGSMEEWDESNNLAYWQDVLHFVYEGKDLLEFDYIDGEGNPSHRIFTLRSIGIDHNGTVFFRGWCRMREDWRTFRMDRFTSKIAFNNDQYTPYEFMALKTTYTEKPPTP